MVSPDFSSMQYINVVTPGEAIYTRPFSTAGAAYQDIPIGNFQETSPEIGPGSVEQPDCSAVWCFHLAIPSINCSFQEVHKLCQVELFHPTDYSTPGGIITGIPFIFVLELDKNGKNIPAPDEDPNGNRQNF